MPAHTTVPDPYQQAPYEAGAPLPAAETGGGLPPGKAGLWAIPHFQTFAQITNWASRVYRWTHDEALKHSHINALAIRRDPVIMEALRARQIPTAQLAWHLECQDDQDTWQLQAVDELTDTIRAIPRWQQLLVQLLEALWYGRAGVQIIYEWDWSSGSRRLKVREHRPIHGDKLVFRYSGEVGVLVNPTFGGDLAVTDRGRAHILTPEEREMILIHRHEPEDADYLEGDLAGGIHGVGIRSRLYWFWWLRSQVMAWLMDYLERVGAGGFTVYYYEAGNDSSLKEVKVAAEEQHRNNVILFPRYRNGETGGPGISRIEPSNAGAQLLQTLVAGYFDEVIRRFILGQNLTSEAQGTGLGSGVADLHADTFGRLVKYDAIGLADTLTTDLVAVLQRYSHPGIPPLRFVFDVDKPNAADVLDSAMAFWNMGGTVDEDELRGIIGLAKPQPGHPMLAKMGSLSPAAAGSLPTGVPFMGPPGPSGMGPDTGGGPFPGMDTGPGLTGGLGLSGQLPFSRSRARRARPLTPRRRNAPQWPRHQ